MAEDDGIVNGQRKLKHNRNGIRDEADLAEQEVGTHVQQSRSTEGQHQHRNLHICSGGKCQNNDNDKSCDYEDRHHLLLEHSIFIITHHGINRKIIRREFVLDFFHGLQTYIVKVTSCKADIIECRCVLKVVGGSIKCNHIHTVNSHDGIVDLFCRFVGDIGYHHLRCSKGHKILIHGNQTLPGFCVIRQVGSHIIFHLHPVHGKEAEYECEYVQQEE